MATEKIMLSRLENFLFKSADILRVKIKRTENLKTLDGFLSGWGYLAGELSKPRFIFVKRSNARCHAKMAALINRAGSQLIRRHFTSLPELIAAVYASLVHYLEDVGCLRTEPFDATDALNATLEDILHPPLRLEKLLLPHASQPNNPLIAEPLFLTKYIEKAGTGTVDMLERCRMAGMRQPEFRIDDGFFILTVWRKRIAAAEDQAEQGVESGPGWHQVGTKLAPG